MTARLIIVPGAMPSRDANGRSLPAKLRFFMPTTTTPAVVYTTSEMTTAHVWPIISDDAGRWPQIWADEQTYFDVAWSDLATDGLIAAYSNIRPLSDAMSASADAAADSAEEAAEAAALAQQALVDTQATIVALGDFSEAAAAAEAGAVTATTKAAEAEASAEAAALSAASIDSDEILIRARASAIAFASLL